ncbi:hypothetical protein GGH94_004931 [Coemansia aciculifera]|uniref:NAD(P)-binding protein n=1 Tax=Coemansia aciculifera TaxID=417176 RepID=A0A9W8IGV8_9FUNG|nr:hypothetical protein GGH94_004931 [Coemansia aciculifera]KAJ2872133.1 hypothetical protein GGH93_004273 [Coemansia aciculifera]
MSTTNLDTYISNISGKVAIVTGAASGLGRKLSERLAEYNAQVLLVDINPSVEQVSQEINTHLSRDATSWIVCDLCNLQDIQKYLDHAIHIYGHYDIIVNNAGIANEQSLFSQPGSTELDRILALNLRAPMEATRIAVQYFKATGRKGTVLNTASVGGLLPISIMESYGTTKAGLIFFTATCKSLAPLIRVNAVAPYFADTPLVANNRLVQSYPLVRQVGLMLPEKVIKAMVKAIGDESLAGDTLMVAMGAKPERLTFYDSISLHVTSYIVSGTVNRYATALSSYFARALDSILGYIRKPVPHRQNQR